eukprot:TRINITY_DN13053_c0_g1_i1.p1 TRINITY_DN13053_c0_g1~~TRINITY_DN13053_c0_g1_i1.p1  ORF type:complete len:540 (+),score=53.74 TRINITY_DN13053_c0_g1_i1:107-1621(+)
MPARLVLPQQTGALRVAAQELLQQKQAQVAVQPNGGSPAAGRPPSSARPPSPGQRTSLLGARSPGRRSASAGRRAPAAALRSGDGAAARREQSPQGPRFRQPPGTGPPRRRLTPYRKRQAGTRGSPPPPPPVAGAKGPTPTAARLRFSPRSTAADGPQCSPRSKAVATALPKGGSSGSPMGSDWSDTGVSSSTASHGAHRTPPPPPPLGDPATAARPARTPPPRPPLAVAPRPRAVPPQSWGGFRTPPPRGGALGGGSPPRGAAQRPGPVGLAVGPRYSPPPSPPRGWVPTPSSPPRSASVGRSESRRRQRSKCNSSDGAPSRGKGVVQVVDVSEFIPDVERARAEVRDRPRERARSAVFVSRARRDCQWTSEARRRSLARGPAELDDSRFRSPRRARLANEARRKRALVRGEPDGALSTEERMPVFSSIQVHEQNWASSSFAAKAPRDCSLLSALPSPGTPFVVQRDKPRSVSAKRRQEELIARLSQPLRSERRSRASAAGDG